MLRWESCPVVVAQKEGATTMTMTSYDKDVFKTTPRSYQLEAYNRFKDSNHFALFFTMGLGKTKTILDIVSYKYLKGDTKALVVIAPNGVHAQWIDEQLPEHLNVPYETFVWDSAKLNRKYYKAQGNRFFKQDNPDKLKVLAINVEAFSHKTVKRYMDFFTQKYGDKVFIALDESTKIKNPSAQRTKALLKYNKCGCRAILTGTPSAKNPYGLWSQFNFLEDDYFDINYFVFQHRYGLLVRDSNYQTGRSFNRAINEKDYAKVLGRIKKMRERNIDAGIGDKLTAVDIERIAMLSNMSSSVIKTLVESNKFVQYRNLDQLKSLIAPITISKDKSEILDLPPKIYTVSYVVMSPEQEKIYNSLKETLRAQYTGRELSVQNKLTLTMRLAQVTGGFFPYSLEDEGVRQTDIKRIESATCKVECLMDDLEGIDFEKTKCIVWAVYVAELKMLYAEISKEYTCCLYYGGIPSSERAEILQDFKAGKYDVFLGNIATGAYGLNLQNASVQLYYSSNFLNEARLQAEDRSHRLGTTAEVVVYKDIVVKGTVDELALESIRQGKELNSFFSSVTLNDILDVGYEEVDTSYNEEDLEGGLL